MAYELPAIPSADLQDAEARGRAPAMHEPQCIAHETATALIYVIGDL